MLAMTAAATPTRMPDYGLFEPTATRRVPREYYVRASGDGLHLTVPRQLRAHGIAVEELAAPRTATVDQFVIGGIRQAERLAQGHRETSVTGRFARRQVELPAGSIAVRSGQPLGRLVFYLLEPESDDGLTTWNVLDAALKESAVHPVLKFGPLAVAHGSN